MPCEYPIVLLDHEHHAMTVRCKGSDSAVCPECAELHRGDVRTSILEALDGAETATFFTLTAPGADAFGQVHSQRKAGGRVRQCPCGSHHADEDPLIGVPINPASYSYDELAAWNAVSRKILTSGIAKLRRLMREKIEYVAVPETSKRGALHWHCIALGTIPPHLIEMAFLGGINPRTGYEIQPAHHEGQTFGPQLDAQILDHKQGAASYLSKYLTKINDSGRDALSFEQQRHLERLSESVLAFHGACDCKITHHHEIEVVDDETGEIQVEDWTTTEPRIHARLPETTLDRMSPWLQDHCHRRRRALRQAGHIGRSLGRSRGAGPSLAELRRRRQAHHIGTDDHVTDQGKIDSLRYCSRGWGGSTYTAFVRDHLKIDISSKIIHFSNCAIPSQGAPSAPSAGAPAAGLGPPATGPTRSSRPFSHDFDPVRALE